MNTELAKITPENLEVANAYLTLGTVKAVSEMTGLNPTEVQEILNKSEVKRYVDNVWLDQGFRNRSRMGALLDEIIESKLEEARESEMYTSKDLLEVLALVHKIRMDEMKAQDARDKISIGKQTNVQINHDPSMGGGNYSKLMKAIIQDGSE